MAAAIELVDRDGLRELSMRRLGQSLGVEAMSLYKYLASRENLLDAVVDTVVDELYADPEVHLLPHDGWQDYLTRLAGGLRRIAVGHPQLFPLVATRPPAAPWMRPPLRSLRWVESFLEALDSRGFSEDQAVYAYRAFTSFLLGHLLLEVSARGANTGPTEEPAADDPPAAPLDGFPRVARLAPKLGEDHSDPEFEDSLRSLLERLERVVAGQQPTP